MFLGNIVFHDPKEFADPHASDGLKVVSNESMDFNDPKEFDDPWYSMIKRKFQLEAWTLIIQKSTVILPSAMVLLLFYQVPLLFLLDVSSAIALC